ncbi:uncharacterized protein [Amphiura filiformis]|uniref:uncharacterized protein n=1 Tax=Amphiura filiformis TaxID=82378 RepID=UPI003B21E5ED
MTRIMFLRIALILSSVVVIGTGGTDTAVPQEYVFSIPSLDIADPTHVFITSTSREPILTTLRIPGVYEVNNTINRYNPADIQLSIDVVGRDVRVNPGDQQHNKTIIIQSSAEILPFVIDNDYAGGDAYLVSPTSRLGTQYHVASYKSYSTATPSCFCISSVYSNTWVKITTPAGQTHRITLNRYESYRFDGGEDEDLSGTFIQSNKPIAVISGVYTQVPEGVLYGDGLIEQLPPVRNWGYNFALTPFLSLNSGYVYRVFTTIHSATLQMSDGSITHIAAESFHEEDVRGNTVLSFTSDQPVMVAQYMKGWHSNNPGRGEPSMIIVTPIAAFTAEVTFPYCVYWVSYRIS